MMESINKGGVMEAKVKPLAFKGTAGGYFIASLVSLVMWYVLIIGWPIAFNFMNAWIVDNLEVNGRKLKYQAEYGETLGFLLVNMILMFITLGIYSFWFVPKSYRFALDHTTYADDGTPVSPAPAPMESGPVIQ